MQWCPNSRLSRLEGSSLILLSMQSLVVRTGLTFYTANFLVLPVVKQHRKKCPTFPNGKSWLNPILRLLVMRLAPKKPWPILVTSTRFLKLCYISVIIIHQRKQQLQYNMLLMCYGPSIWIKVRELLGFQSDITFL